MENPLQSGIARHRCERRSLTTARTLEEQSRVVPSSLTHLDFSHVVQRYAKSALIRVNRRVIVRQPLPDRQRPPVRFHRLGRMIGGDEDRADAVMTRGQLPLEIRDGGVVAQSAHRLPVRIGMTRAPRPDVPCRSDGCRG